MSSIAYTIAAHPLTGPIVTAADPINWDGIQTWAIKVLAIVFIAAAVIIGFSAKKSKFSDVGSHTGILIVCLAVAGLGVAMLAAPSLVGTIGGGVAHIILNFAG